MDDPADLCTVNISGQGLIDCREEDFSLFENVAFINAAENLLVPGAVKFPSSSLKLIFLLYF